MATYDHEDFSGRSWAAMAPWPFILLFVMTILFFAGGIVLDALANQVSSDKIRSLFPTSERTIERKTGDEREVVRDTVMKPEDRSALIQFEKEKSDRLAASARLLYDMAKIALGALLTCLTQMINAVVVGQRRVSPE